MATVAEMMRDELGLIIAQNGFILQQNMLILNKLRQLKKQGQRIMATQQELSDELDAIKTGVDAVKLLAREQVVLIEQLTAQIAAGTPVTQEQLDALDVKADSILASLSA